MKESLKRSFASLGADGLVALWLGVWWCANLIEAGCTELANDEAYYHMFAQRLAWGYFDHPPVTALLVWLGERLFGGELGVRFFFTVLQPLYLWACPTGRCWLRRRFSCGRSGTSRRAAASHGSGWVRRSR